MLKTTIRASVRLAPAFLLFFASAQMALAEQIIFTIDTAQSTLSLAGSDDAFGTLVAQGPGSNAAPISGHFMVEFDPAAPSDIQFILGHGFMRPAVTGNWLPGPIAQADTDDPNNGDINNPYPGYNIPAPAELAVQTAGGQLRYASRNHVWDFATVDPLTLNPQSIPLSNGTFDVTQLAYQLRSMDWVLVAEDYRFSGDFFGHAHNATGAAGFMTSGTASLQESAPGSGSWTIAGNVAVAGRYTAHLDPSVELGTLIFMGNFVATAQFGAGNVDAVGAGESSGSALGGAGTTGGVDVSFDQVTAGGTLSAQEIPTTGLSFDALQALASETNFQLAGATPQIWDVSFGGQFTGPLTLTFGYDESLLGGVSEADLYMWHFDDALNDWERIFGSVDANLNTITISTASLSPFALGAPEPGDANFDDFVDGGDYTIWADHYLQTGQTWATGDFTGDGLVDGGDYTVWADHYAPAFAASAVPEPSTLALTGIGTLALLACMARRRLLV